MNGRIQCLLLAESDASIHSLIIAQQINRTNLFRLLIAGFIVDEFNSYLILKLPHSADFRRNLY
jgi:hypothetical protein